MCGIAGVSGNEKGLVMKMARALSHRGPDNEGFYTDSFFSLGHRRLSIIDLSEKGKQPMPNEDQSIWVDFNGEIYNFLELRKDLEQKGHSFYSNTDSEVLVHGYEEYGPKFVEQLEGMFAYAIYDTARKKVFLFRDHTGIKPLFYYWDQSLFGFASELGALMELPVPRTLNRASLSHYWELRFVPGPLTLFENMFKLPPAHWLEFDGKKVSLHAYWQAPYEHEKPLNEYVHALRMTLERSVSHSLISDVPIGIFLSGGLDSSILAGLMAQQGEVRTFSVGFEGSSHSEAAHAEHVATHIGSIHTELSVSMNALDALPKIVKHFGEPLADPTAIPTYFMAEQARKKVKVVLTGEGADEWFGGYEQVRLAQALEGFSKTPSAVRKGLVLGAKKMPAPVMKALFEYAPLLGEEGINRLDDFLHAQSNVEKYLALVGIFSEREKREAFGNSHANAKELFQPFFEKNNLVHGIVECEIAGALPDNLSAKVDRMTMAFGLEARVPYLNPSVINLAAAIPLQYKVHNGIEKFILRKTFSNLLPKAIVQRKKHRFFVPLHEWMQEALGDQAWNACNELVRECVMQKDFVEKMKRNYSKSPLYYARQLWCVLNFAEWKDLFDVNCAVK
ncbi:MAG: asparagine synthase (glutamine-hydrolyzing) [Candidatus Diapherotrites archaeon]|nr:asparagine synthase (glutamine-hydrolyzing) [Candidatus Diapherotrites archaeon]